MIGSTGTPNSASISWTVLCPDADLPRSWRSTSWIIPTNLALGCLDIMVIASRIAVWCVIFCGWMRLGMCILGSCGMRLEEEIQVGSAWSYSCRIINVTYPASQNIIYNDNSSFQRCSNHWSAFTMLSDNSIISSDQINPRSADLRALRPSRQDSKEKQNPHPSSLSYYNRIPNPVLA